MYRVAVVEDNPADSQNLQTMLKRYSEEYGVLFEVEAFSRPDSFLTSCGQSFDLVFMDIELPEMDGMEAARRLREIDSLVTLVFVTNMAQYALNGYEVAALDFILKPVSYASFAMKLRRAVKNIRKLEDTELHLVLPNGFIRLPTSQVLYAEVQKHYLTYHTEEEAYTVRGSMKEAEERLTPLHFLRCNNCYLVNLRRVTAVQDNTVTVGKVPLQISRPRRAAFLKELTDYLGGNIK